MISTFVRLSLCLPGAIQTKADHLGRLAAQGGIRYTVLSLQALSEWLGGSGRWEGGKGLECDFL